MNDEIIALKQQIEPLAEIGTYTFPSGKVVKAISVSMPNFPPPGTVTEGLEIVIIPGKDISAQPVLNQGLLVKLSHEIHLKQWDDSKTTLPIIMPLMQLLSKNNYSVQIGLRILPNPKIGNIESRNLTISKTLALRRH